MTAPGQLLGPLRQVPGLGPHPPLQGGGVGGDVDSEEDGEFALRFLVNAGQREDCGSLYVGAQSAIDVRKIHEFASEVEAVAAGLISVPVHQALTAASLEAIRGALAEAVCG